MKEEAHVTRAECIAELRLRRDACQRTAEIHPCELARARSEGRTGGYDWAVLVLERSGSGAVRTLDLEFQATRKTLGHGAGRREALRNALELVGRIVEAA